jgi:Na+/citrate or Na+/malate symporter
MIAEVIGSIIPINKGIMLQTTLDRTIAIVQIAACVAALVCGVLIGMLIHFL